MRQTLIRTAIAVAATLLIGVPVSAQTEPLALERSVTVEEDGIRLSMAIEANPVVAGRPVWIDHEADQHGQGRHRLGQRPLRRHGPRRGRDAGPGVAGRPSGRPSGLPGLRVLHLPLADRRRARPSASRSSPRPPSAPVATAAPRSATPTASRLARRSPTGVAGTATRSGSSGRRRAARPRSRERSRTTSAPASRAGPGRRSRPRSTSSSSTGSPKTACTRWRSWTPRSLTRGWRRCCASATASSRSSSTTRTWTSGTWVSSSTEGVTVGGRTTGSGSRAVWSIPSRARWSPSSNDRGSRERIRSGLLLASRSTKAVGPGPTSGASRATRTPTPPRPPARRVDAPSRLWAPTASVLPSLAREAR